MQRTKLTITSIVLLALRIPFIFTHHIQEDAYITFRTAFNLADHGSFSFNLGEHTPATTSLLYPILIALLRLLFHHWTIYVVQLADSALAILASYLIAKALGREPRFFYAFWVILSSGTMTLYIGYSGMETSLVILAIATLFYSLRFPTKPFLPYTVMLLLPFLRPDAIAFGLIFASAVFLIDRSRSVLSVISMTVGIASFLLANFIISGHMIPGTMRAKEIAYHPNHSLSAILARAGHTLLFDQCFLFPTPIRPWVRLGPVLVLSFIAVSFFTLRSIRPQRNLLIVYCAVLASVVFVPIAFVVGGVVFPWYLYPSNWLAQAVVVYFIISLPALTPHIRIRKLLWTGVALGWFLLLAGEYIHGVRAASEDFHYRGDVGRLIAEISHGKGTLFLEPAGYIPYYSELKTQDEVGLVDSEILDYMKQYPEDWWIHYVEKNRPNYLVERGAFANYVTFQEYQLTTEESFWFNKNYRLIRHFQYNPNIYYTDEFHQKLVAGTTFATEYLLYERVDGVQ